MAGIRAGHPRLCRDNSVTTRPGPSDRQPETGRGWPARIPAVTEKRVILDLLMVGPGVSLFSMRKRDQTVKLQAFRSWRMRGLPPSYRGVARASSPAARVIEKWPDSADTGFETSLCRTRG